MVQLSRPYMTTRKTIALTRQTFVGKVMSLLFDTLSRFVIDFLPRSKCLNLMATVTIHSGLKSRLLIFGGSGLGVMGLILSSVLFQY